MNEATCLIVFGITGDLAKRKVLPAIYHLFKQGLLTADTRIVGTSRRAMTNDELLAQVELCVLEVDNVCDPVALQQFKDSLQMVQVDPVEDADYSKLKNVLDQLDADRGQAMNRLFYLSIPPQVYGPVIKRLGSSGLSKHQGPATSRLLVEKPFGYDVASAEALIAETAESFNEDQIFRIDHYLAKETAQNILTFRRHNPLFAAVWNNQHIRAVEVTAAEKIGIEGRANFYDSIGAMRDLVQSHMLQLLTITLMDLPAQASNTDQLHDFKQNFLEALSPLAADTVSDHVVRAQYEGYRSEVENPESTTETFVSLELYSDLPQWQGVPLRLTTGKALAEKLTTITVYIGSADSDINQLTFRIQPNEGIDVQLMVKTPGYDVVSSVQPADMNFSYSSTFAAGQEPEAYERVLIDAIRGDKTLFATSAEVLASWRALQPVLDAWARDNSDLRTYPKGADASSVIEARS